MPFDPPSPGAAALTIDPATLLIKSSAQAGFFSANDILTGAQCATGFIQNLIGSITAVSGGAPGDLDYIPTAGGAVAQNTAVQFFAPPPGGGASEVQGWFFAAGTNATDATHLRPIDYNASSNPNVWNRFL